MNFVYDLYAMVPDEYLFHLHHRHLNHHDLDHLEPMHRQIEFDYRVSTENQQQMDQFFVSVDVVYDMILLLDRLSVYRVLCHDFDDVTYRMSLLYVDLQIAVYLVVIQVQLV